MKREGTTREVEQVSELAPDEAQAWDLSAGARRAKVEARATGSWEVAYEQ